MNLTYITNVTDRVLDIFLRTKGGEDGITVEHLTPAERVQLVDLLGVPASTFTSVWVAGHPAEKPIADSIDYEGLILDEADECDGDYL